MTIASPPASGCRTGTGLAPVLVPTLPTMASLPSTTVPPLFQGSLTTATESRET